jgi:hypothetical protein
MRPYEYVKYQNKMGSPAIAKQGEWMISSVINNSRTGSKESSSREFPVRPMFSN